VYPFLKTNPNMVKNIISRIEITKGDITKINAGAIVNAANTTLLGGGGVDGAIHSAAGPQLLEECRKLGGCPTGEARITKGYNLPAKYVIHTVGPVYRDGHHREPELLANCYKNSLHLAKENNIETIAFPSISTGIYSYPVADAAEIAFETIYNFLTSHSIPTKVTIVCYDIHTEDVYKKIKARY
jgi:O-acetyl-ADP-ribose deacetylase